MYYKHTPKNVFHNREITLQNEAGFFLEAAAVRNEKKSICYVTNAEGQANQVFRYTEKDMLQSVISGLFLEIEHEKHAEGAILQMSLEKHPKDEQRRRDLEKKLVLEGKYVPNKVSLEHVKDHQQWSFRDGYLISKLHGLVLDTPMLVQRGSNVCVNFPSGKASQKWKIRFAGKDAELQQKYEESLKNLNVPMEKPMDQPIQVPNVIQDMMHMMPPQPQIIEQILPMDQNGTIEMQPYIPDHDPPQFNPTNAPIDNIPFDQFDGQLLQEQGKPPMDQQQGDGEFQLEPEAPPM